MQGARRERRTGQAARPGRADLGGAAGQVVAGQGGVGGDDAGQPELHGQVRDRVDVLVGQVGRDLDQQRDLAAAGPGGRLTYGGQHRAQPGGGLQVAQPGSVRRADVDHEIVDLACQQTRAQGVIRGGLGLRHRPGLADVRPDREAAASAGAQPGGGRGGAVVVEAHAVDQCPVGGQPEQPRPGVARLRPGGHGSHLDEGEAQHAQRVGRERVLVEARREPERAGQVAAECPHPQHRVGRAEPAAQQPGRPGNHGGRADQTEPEPVRGLGPHPPQEQREQQVVHGLCRAAPARRVSRRTQRAEPAGRRE